MEVPEISFMISCWTAEQLQKTNAYVYSELGTIIVPDYKMCADAKPRATTAIDPVVVVDIRAHRR